MADTLLRFALKPAGLAPLLPNGHWIVDPASSKTTPFQAAASLK